ncbi:hypothetical protein BC835DRAFT_1424502 [Cytidiella melzeri]|nr:hypothetical protein BC835DRAFT_1424502 [Cytidiella melzeri]
MSVVTKGGDPSYGNAHFLKNVKEWTKSIDNFPDFVDFGPLPCFVGIWELATTQARRDALQTAYTQFTTYYTQDLSLPGPYLHARQSEDFDGEEDAFMGIGIGHIVIKFPATRTDGWYFISPTLAGGPCTLAKELVPGALAPVKWVEVFVAPYYDEKVTRVWKAVPPTSDYVALGFVAMSGKSASQIPLQPPAALAGQFRAVHKRALTVDTNGVGDNLIFQGPQNHLVFAVGARYWLTDVKIPPPEDCFVLDPKVAVLDWDN